MKSTALTARHRLVRQLSYGEQVYQPDQLVLLLHRECQPGNCTHCAAGSRHDSLERLSRPHVEQVFEQAQSSLVQFFTISGGEPFARIDELLFALRIGAQAGLPAGHINTNAFWASDQDAAYEVLIRVAQERTTGLPGMPALLSSIDSMHRVPSQNLIHLIDVHKRVFPWTSVHLAQMLETTSREIQDKFVRTLIAQRVIFDDGDVVRQDHDFGRMVVPGLISHIILSTFFRTFIVFNYDMISRVQRGGRLRENYLTAPLTDRDLAQGHSHYARVGDDHMCLVLGWDGKFYLSVMHAWADGLLPLGNLEDGLDAAVAYANQDPVQRSIIEKGMGYIFNVARRIDPSLDQAKAEFNTHSGLAIHIMQRPELLLKVTRQLVREDIEQGRLSEDHARLLGWSWPWNKAKAKPAPEAMDFKRLAKEINRVLASDWTGRETTIMKYLAELLKQLTPAEQIHLLRTSDFHGQEGRFLWIIINMLNNGDAEVQDLARQALRCDERFCRDILRSHDQSTKAENLDRYGRLLFNLLNARDLSGLIHVVTGEETKDQVFLLSQVIATIALVGQVNYAARLLIDLTDDAFVGQLVRYFKLDLDRPLLQLLCQLIPEKRRERIVNETWRTSGPNVAEQVEDNLFLRRRIAF
jgi:hypothetical protein